MYFQKKLLQDIPEENTTIWSCTKEGCNGWMRDNFAFEHVPTCSQCESPMEKSTKLLPVLVNSNIELKEMKKGVQIKKSS